jgi:hypothetical protein
MKDACLQIIHTKKKIFTMLYKNIWPIACVIPNTSKLPIMVGCLCANSKNLKPSPVTMRATPRNKVDQPFDAFIICWPDGLASARILS